MNKKVVGFLLMATSIVTLILYVWLLLFTPTEGWLIYGMPIRWWAVAIPTLIIAISALAIITWAGYLLFTMPKPQPIEERIEREREHQEAAPNENFSDNARQER
jgi:hypothetical protein